MTRPFQIQPDWRGISESRRSATMQTKLRVTKASARNDWRVPVVWVFTFPDKWQVLMTKAKFLRP
jgi:hypothetical protein